MGSIIGKSMEEGMKKNQEFMLASQRMQMERQMMMQDAMREQQMAIQIARGRDLFHWWASFYAVAGLGIIAGFSKSKNPKILLPIVPLTFVVGYLGDMAYGGKVERMKVEAQKILTSEGHLLELPQPLPNLEELDSRRANHWRT